MPPDPHTRRGAPHEGASRITTTTRDHREHTENGSQRVDLARYRLGLAQQDSVAAVIAADVLGDTVFHLEDLEIKLAMLRLLDAADRNLRWAVA